MHGARVISCALNGRDWVANCSPIDAAAHGGIRWHWPAHPADNNSIFDSQSWRLADLACDATRAWAEFALDEQAVGQGCTARCWFELEAGQLALWLEVVNHGRTPVISQGACVADLTTTALPESLGGRWRDATTDHGVWHPYEHAASQPIDGYRTWLGSPIGDPRCQIDALTIGAIGGQATMVWPEHNGCRKLAIAQVELDRQEITPGDEAEFGMTLRVAPDSPDI